MMVTTNLSVPQKSASVVTMLGGKSWITYVGVILISLLLGSVALVLSDSKYWQVGACLGVVAVVYLVHRILVLRSYRFYMDDVGVWFSCGYLPWAKFDGGVKWRDLDMANYYPSFFSWLFRSYSVKVQHRFTRVNQIFLTHMHNGRRAAWEINRVHQEYIRDGRLK